MITGTTQNILDWSRFIIPDPKTRNKAVRRELLGQTVAATNSRETFFIKQLANASVFIYVDPYKYSSTASIGGATAGDKVFQYVAASQSVTFAKFSEKPTKPSQFQKVYATYEYTEDLPFTYTNLELSSFIPQVVGYLNNTFEYSLSYSTSTTGTTGVTVAVSDTDETEIVAKALAINVRRSYVNEQKKRGLGIRFRGPLQSIDSVAQLKSYIDETKRLEQELETKLEQRKLAGSAAGVGIDVYEENVVDA